MADVGILNLQIHDDSSGAEGSLKRLEGALRNVKSAVEGIKALSSVGNALKKINEQINNFRVDGTIENLNGVAAALKRIKEASDFTIPNLSGLSKLKKYMDSSAAGKDAMDQIGKQGKDAVGTMEESFGKAEAEVRNITDAVKEMNEQMGQTNTSVRELDFSQFNVSELPLGAIGMTMDQFRNGAKEIVNFGDAFRETDAIVSNMRMKANLDAFKENDPGTGIILYNENLENSWERICEREAEAKRQLDEYLASMREQGWGTGSIKPIYENAQFGPVLSGLKGAEEQMEAIRQISAGTGLSTEEIMRQLTEFSNGAIRFGDAAERVNNAANEAANDGMSSFNREVEQIANSTEPAISKIELLQNKLQHLWSRVAMLENMPEVDEFGKDTGRNNAINNYMLKIGSVYEQLQRIIEKSQQAQNELRGIQMAQEAANNRPTTDNNLVIDSLVKNYSEIELLTMKMEGMKQALADDITQNKVDTQQIAERTMAIQKLKEKIDELKQAQENASRSTSLMDNAWGHLKSGMTAMFPTISGLLKRFKGMAIMRTLRYAVRELAKGFSEGVQNVYQYSKVVGTSFAPAMDSAATALLQMKNSIGAAVAPLIQMLIPALKSVISVLIQGINYINQFFALLNGQSSWTEAVEYQTEAYTDNANAANSAAKAAKDLLADWDELNIIQSAGGGGGTGAGANSNTPDYSQMFHEVSEYDERIKKLVDGIKEQFGSVWDLVKKIGLAILGWKISNAFGSILGTLGGLAGAAITLDIVFNLVNMFAKNYLSTGDEGWLVGNVLTTLIGGYFTRKLLGKVLNGRLAAFAIPLTLTVSAFANAKAILESTDVSALSEENIKTSILSGLEMGGALAYLLYKGGGYTMGYSAGMGGGLALMTFGVLIGLTAIKNTIDTHQITPDTIKADLLAAGAFGGGLTLMGVASGAGLVGSLALGGVGAVVAFGVLIGLELLIANTPNAITWGDEKASKEQIENYIKAKGFTVDVAATIQLIEDSVSILPDERTKIEQDVAKELTTMHVIELGLATGQTYDQLKEDLFGKDGSGGAIGRIKAYAKDQQTMLETTLTFVPIINENGEEDKEATKEFMKAGKTGWDEVEKYMGDIGTRLAEALKGNTKDGIKTFDDELIAELMGELTNVQRAMADATISAQSVGGLASGLSSVNKETFDQSLAVWNNYKKQLQDEYNKAMTEELTSYQSLAAFYRTRGNEGDEELAEYYEGKATDLLAMWDDRLQAAIDKASAPGREMFRKAIIDMLNVDIQADDITAAIGRYTNYSMGADGFVKQIFNNGQIQTDYFKTFLNNVLETAFGENYDTIKKLIDAGALEYGDLISKEFFKQIVDGLDFGGSSSDNNKKRQQLKDAFDSIFGMGNGKPYTVSVEMEPVVEESKVEKAKEQIDEQVEKSAEQSDIVQNAINDVINQSMLPGSNIAEVIEAAKQQYGTEVIEKAMPEIQAFMDEHNLVIPKADDTSFGQSLQGCKDAVKDFADYTSEQMKGIDGESATVRIYTEYVDPGYGGGGGGAGRRYMQKKASGGYVRSGDLVMANENGNFEMMGRMGHQPVVANNQQIVSGISNGVANANEDVVSELRVLTTLMQRLLSKELVAKVVPSSSIGRSNQMSAEAYDRVTG